MAKWEDDILRGRTSITNIEKRTEGYRLRLTPEEKYKLRMLAETEGVTMSDFLRNMINDEFNQMLGYGVKGRTWL